MSNNNGNGNHKPVKPVKHRPPTPKQLKVLKGVIEGKTQTQAALDAGYSPSRAAQTGHEIVRKRKDVYLKLFEDKGGTDEKLAETHVDGLNALKRTEHGVDKDYSTRHKYLESAYKLKGYEAPTQIDVSFGLAPEIIEQMKRRSQGAA